MMWTPEEIALVTQFANEGYSSTQIAAALRTKTRNAVIGKLNRIGVKLKQDPVGVKKQSVAQEPRPSSAVVVVRKPVERYFPPQVMPENLIELVDLRPHQCRWPFGDRNFKFCGKQKATASSYCAEHKLVSERGYETTI